MKWIETMLLWIGVLCAMITTVTAQEIFTWKDDIVAEIQEAHGCEASFFSHVLEREIKGKAVVMVKVHCEDKRAFDAIRQGEDEMFTFTKCRAHDERVC